MLPITYTLRKTFLCAIWTSILAIVVLMLSVIVDALTMRNPEVARTNNCLGNLGNMVVGLKKSGASPDSYSSMSELLVLARTREFITDEDLPRYERDSWGRPFELTIKKEPERTIVRITSLGKNGVQEHGKGDDLYVEVILWKMGEPEIRLKSGRKVPGVYDQDLREEKENGGVLLNISGIN